MAETEFTPLHAEPKLLEVDAKQARRELWAAISELVVLCGGSMATVPTKTTDKIDFWARRYAAALKAGEQQ